MTRGALLVSHGQEPQGLLQKTLPGGNSSEAVVGSAGSVHFLACSIPLGGVLYQDLWLDIFSSGGNFYPFVRVSVDDGVKSNESVWEWSVMSTRILN